MWVLFAYGAAAAICSLLAVLTLRDLGLNTVEGWKE